MPGAAYARGKKLNTRQVAAAVGVTPFTIRRWAKIGLFPRGVELVPGELRWLESTVFAWIAEREKGPVEQLARPRKDPHDP